MRYRLRTLMIILAIGPPIVAWSVLEWRRTSELRAKQRAEAAFREAIKDFERKMQPLTWTPSPTSFPEFANSPQN
jgi:hypothetical protein